EIGRSFAAAWARELECQATPADLDAQQRDRQVWTAARGPVQDGPDRLGGGLVRALADDGGRPLEARQRLGERLGAQRARAVGGGRPFVAGRRLCVRDR